MTQLEYARKDRATTEIKYIAKHEGIDIKELLKKIAEGKVVVPSNRLRKKAKPCAIGEGLKTKVNANIGTSPDSASLKVELKKLKVAVENGADTVMDLSIGGDLNKIRKAILRASPVPVGTVPIYEVAVNATRKKKAIPYVTEDEIFETIERQARQGVDFFTLHCGVTMETVERLKKEGRIADVVSRGGAILIEWMVHNGKENPLYVGFDKILEIAKRYDVTLSLGDGMRPGSLADATDRAQIQELLLLGELTKRAYEAGVGVMIEGPGHVPLNQIESNVLLEKRVCHGAPFYVLGPLVTDVAPGYDHITSAIGGALAAAYGADFLCYVTPSEHLSLPSVSDVKIGVISSRIAAHAADIAKNIKGALDWDIAMSMARKRRDWEKQFKLAIDCELPRQYRKRSRPSAKDVCTMCSQYCSMKLADEYLR